MAKKFKDYYGVETARLLAEKISTVSNNFNEQAFILNIQKNIKGKEFLERQDVYVDAFEQYLGNNYQKNIRTFQKILGPELQTTEGMFIYGWWLWPVGRYVERHGTKNISLSLNFIYELTKRFTGEFAMRPLLAKYPKESLEYVLLWSKDENVHVRRLASECLRPKLPWATKSTVALENFKIYKKILTNLCEDNEKFVQKSVGNNLNDLMKIDASKAYEIIASWEKKKNISPATKWIINHGLRSLKKNKVK